MMGIYRRLWKAEYIYGLREFIGSYPRNGKTIDQENRFINGSKLILKRKMSDEREPWANEEYKIGKTKSRCSIHSLSIVSL